MDHVQDAHAEQRSCGCRMITYHEINEATEDQNGQYHTGEHASYGIPKFTPLLLSGELQD
ncbi:MAG: hypothetical protein ABSE85_18080 [Candidatus Korobacteraceae bacterium]